MASLCTKIELYLGRTPDFYEEVQVLFQNNTYTIDKWECKDKPRPEEADLCSDEEADLYDNMRHLREKRNRLLAETDWWASSDLTMSQEQTSYRQALRDLPATADPANPIWPTKP